MEHTGGVFGLFHLYTSQPGVLWGTPGEDADWDLTEDPLRTFWFSTVKNAILVDQSYNCDKA